MVWFVFRVHAAGVGAITFVAVAVAAVVVAPGRRPKECPGLDQERRMYSGCWRPLPDGPRGMSLGTGRNMKE